MFPNLKTFLTSKKSIADLKGWNARYKLHLGDVWADFLRLPHDTIPAAVITNKANNLVPPYLSKRIYGKI